MPDIKEPRAPTPAANEPAPPIGRDKPAEVAPRASAAPSLWMASPFALMQRFAADTERLFDEFGLGHTWLSPRLLGRGRELLKHGLEGALMPWSPRIEVLEEVGQLVINTELPGLTKDDVKVEVSHDLLTIQGERKQEKEEKREGFYHSERHYGSFYRAIPLPEGVDTSKASVTFKDGLLKVTIPSPSSAKPRGRLLEIQEG